MNWGDQLSEIKCRAFDYVIAVADIYDNEKETEIVFNTILELSGNGSKLIIGFKRYVTNDESNIYFSEREEKFRETLGKYFHVRTSFQRFYPLSENTTVSIIEITRTPFSTVLQRDFGLN